MKIYVMICLLGISVNLMATTTVVSSITELQQAISKAMPGDIILVKKGVYTTTGDIKIDRTGTKEKPITIAAEEAGLAEITGVGGFNLVGPAAYIVIRGFIFTHAASKARSGAGTSFCRWTHNIFETSGTGEYLTIAGSDHEVDYNTFRNKDSLGRFIAVRGAGSQIAERLWIHHNYFKTQKNQGNRNGAEALQFGLSGFSLSSSNSLVEHNLFEDCAGENELISIKASRVTIRYNTIRNCPAQFTLRHGNFCQVYGNYFINTPGLRIFGDDHLIYSNHFENCSIGINIGNGGAEVADGAPLTSHDRPDRVTIAFNTLVNNKANIIQTARANGLGSTHITVANNIIEGGGPAASIVGPSVSPSWEGNIIFNTQGPGDMPAGSFIYMDPKLVRDAAGEYHLQPGSPAIDAGKGNYAFVTTDMDGQSRKEPLDAGADELSNTAVTARILQLTDVGLVGSAEFNINNFGAVGDGKTLNTTFIQNAIDACYKSGGGKVVFPAGTYLSGTIELKSNITLYFDKDARLLGSTDIEQYRNLDPFTEGLGIDVGWALLVAVDAQHISIEGPGAIDGQGAKLKAEHILKDTRPEGQRWGRRPFLVRIVRCKDVKVKDITLNYAGAWTSHYFQSTDIQIEHVTIVSVGVAHNDGIGIDGCQNVRINNCDVVSGDDALVFKTTSSKMACKNIVVSNMRLKSNQAGIKMGTESMASFEDITISNCHIYDTRNGGIKLLSVDGGHIRNIAISDITMTNVRTPMLFRLGSRLSVFRKGQDTQQTTGRFENVVVRNVKAISADSTQLTPPTGILITGVPKHNIVNLTLENIEIDLPGTGTAKQARHAVPEAIDQYPEVKTFGPVIPAYGIWARHVGKLTLRNITLRLKNNDLRPAFVCEEGADIEVTGWHIPATYGANAIIRLENVLFATIQNNEVKGKARCFVKIEGAESKQINVKDVLPFPARRRGK